MINPVVNVIVSLVVGLGSAAMATLLAPRIQHRFWTYQQAVKLRLDTARAVGELVQERINLDITKAPTQEFTQHQLAVTRDVEVLFSARAVERYHELDRTVSIGVTNLNDRDQIREELERLRALRREVLRLLYREALQSDRLP